MALGCRVLITLMFRMQDSQCREVHVVPSVFAHRTITELEFGVQLSARLFLLEHCGGADQL